MYKDTDYARSKYVGVGGAVIQELNEWEVVGQWMWDNRESYNGLSVLPYFGGSYLQAPFEDITEEEYNKRISTLHSLDLTKVMEIDDNVEFGQVVACSGSNCSIE